MANDSGSSTAVVKEEKIEEKTEVETEAPCLLQLEGLAYINLNINIHCFCCL